MVEAKLAEWIIGMLIEHGPEVIKMLKKLFASAGSAEAALETIRNMKTREELDAEVDAGDLEEPWRTYRTTVDAALKTARGLHFLIKAQSMFKPSSVTQEQLDTADEALKKAEAAHTKALAAIEAVLEKPYKAQAAALAAAAATLLKVKKDVCPVLTK